jgi:tetratricopeptide (TPR) repeat protein
VSERRNRRPLLIRFFRHYLADEDSARFINETSQHYTINTLERLAEFGSRTTRRGATLALGYLGDYQSNQVLGRRMNDEDRSVRLLAENGIRELWCRDGNGQQRAELQRIMRLNRSNQYDSAISAATSLIEEAPWFAEAWNQRAIARYYLSQYRDAANDCHQTLELNAYHYAAAVGMAHCYLEMDDARAALECFRRAIKLNPDLEEVRTRISFLRQALKEEK